MSDEYQLRKDIDNINKFAYDINNNQLGLVKKDTLIDDINELLSDDDTLRLEKYYDISEVDSLIQGSGGGSPTGDYITEDELMTILDSYVTVNYASSTYAPIHHTHTIADLDVNVTTLELVDYETNPDGVLCFSEKYHTDLDIELDMELQNNGYLKIYANLIERGENNNGTSS